MYTKFMIADLPEEELNTIIPAIMEIDRNIAVIYSLGNLYISGYIPQFMKETIISTLCEKSIGQDGTAVFQEIYEQVAMYDDERNCMVVKHFIGPSY